MSASPIEERSSVAQPPTPQPEAVASTRREVGTGRAVLAASTGGHLAEMVRFQATLPIDNDPLWITFDHPQSRALLAGQRVAYVPYIESRGYFALFKAMRPVWKALRKEKAETVYSTGSALALAVLPLAKMQGSDATYIESVSRFDGPSMSGRILAKLRGIRVFTQHAVWADKRWKHGPSLMTSYQTEQRPQRLDRPLRVFITLGTIKPYRFDRLINRLRAIIPPEAEVRLQFGETTTEHDEWDCQAYMASAEFDAAIEWADCVVTHAGVGTALRTLDLGKLPVMATRLAKHGEHVDDHQVQITRYLDAEGLAIGVEAEEINFADLERAADTRVVS